MFQGILSTFQNLLRNWDWVEDPPTLLGQIPKFDHFFEGFPYPAFFLTTQKQLLPSI